MKTIKHVSNFQRTRAPVASIVSKYALSAIESTGGWSFGDRRGQKWVLNMSTAGNADGGVLRGSDVPSVS
ncbi:unnamed protein product [Toxocara canis]|uniref:DUF2793 domain-containing protein n=1 Tax=Toxocara canis TaxID=6265 RepID=A0A183UPZ3_TOXCA|nr:unnamed protein product [Toxocara canis]